MSRWLLLLSQYRPSIVSTKAYPTADTQNAKSIIALGEVCSATSLLPTSALLSAELEKRGEIAVASGGFTDIWRGEYYARQVAIKTFRIYPAQNLKQAKEVSTQPPSEVCSRTSIFRSCGNGSQCGGSYPMIIFCHSAASQQHFFNLPSFTTGDRTATLVNT